MKRVPRSRATRLALIVPAVALLLSLATAPSGAEAVSYSAEEVRLVELLNDYRVSLGLEPLMVSDLCSEAAEKHSTDMAKYAFFNHYTLASDWFPVGSNARVRMALCGYGAEISWGENIAAGYSKASTLIEAWKESTQGHDEIMTTPMFKVVGIALVYVPDSEYTYYWTADFGSFVDQTAHWLDDSGPSTTTTSTTTTTIPSTTTTTTTDSTTTTTSTTVIGQAFSDVPSSNLFYEPITSLAAAGVVSGYSDGTFCPAGLVTRAQLAKIVVSALGQHTPEIDNASSPTFTDVPCTGAVYPFDYVEEAAKLGIIQGYSTGIFAPSANVTRLQLAAMLVRAGGDDLAPPPPGYVCPFGDVPVEARTTIEIALYNGLLSGKTATRFDSYGAATRGHVAKMVYGLMQVVSP